jgi:hypothetical protein
MAGDDAGQRLVRVAGEGTASTGCYGRMKKLETLII